MDCKRIENKVWREIEIVREENKVKQSQKEIEVANYARRIYFHYKITSLKKRNRLGKSKFILEVDTI